jgi:LuxR family transcriptional regulator, regulator of acetate metabolism
MTRQPLSAARRHADLERSLHRLRQVEGSTELVERTGEAAARGCGLQRVLLSRIDDGVWSPWKHYDGRPTPAPAAVIPLEQLPLEADLARTGRPAILTDAREHPLYRLLQWHSFAVAPIAPAGRPLGLLHAGRTSEQQPVTREDRDVLWMFAESFGRLYEREIARERLELQREYIRAATAHSDMIMSGLRAEIDLVRLVGSERPPLSAPDEDRPDPIDFDEQFTARERDVLELMVLGRSNAAIAEQLAVSTSTVKSHVRSILRKLGAVNRVEAIAAVSARSGTGRYIS